MRAGVIAILAKANGLGLVERARESDTGQHLLGDLLRPLHLLLAVGRLQAVRRVHHAVDLLLLAGAANVLLEGLLQLGLLLRIQ